MGRLRDANQSIGMKAPTCQHLQCYSYYCLVTSMNYYRPVICGIGQFKLMLEGKQVTQEWCRWNVNMCFTNLPAYASIEYKPATLAFRYFDGTLPPYLSHCLSSYTPHRSLQSPDKPLCVPEVNLKSADARSFQYQAPCVWNSVPIQTLFSTSLTSFKSSLKTHLLRNAFTLSLIHIWRCRRRR